MQHYAGQIDVAPAFDVELRIAVDLRLRDCARDKNKVKLVSGQMLERGSSIGRSRAAKKRERNFSPTIAALTHTESFGGTAKNSRGV